MNAKFFGQFLLDRGVITPDQLIDAIDYQDTLNSHLGVLALDQRLLDVPQVRDIIQEQQTSDRMFGEIAVAKGYLTREALEELLAAQIEQNIYLGEALVRLGHLTLERLDQELAAFKGQEEQTHARLAQAAMELPDGPLAWTALEAFREHFGRLARCGAKLLAPAPPVLAGAGYRLAILLGSSDTVVLALALSMDELVLERIVDSLPGAMEDGNSAEGTLTVILSDVITLVATRLTNQGLVQGLDAPRLVAPGRAEYDQLTAHPPRLSVEMATTSGSFLLHVI